MSSKKTAGDQEPTHIEQERNFEQVGEHEPDRDGGQPGGGQKGKSPTAIIAVQDGPQTGGNERGNPGV